MDLIESISNITGWLTNSFQIQAIDAGGNNKPFKIQKNNEVFFAKQYYRDKSDHRNRGLTEFNFSKSIWELGVQNIPQPLFYDDEQNIGIYSYIDGHHVNKPIDRNLINYACGFFDKINSNNVLLKSFNLPNASEACFSIQSHIQTIKSRLDRLLVSPAESSIDIAAKHFVTDELVVNFNKELQVLNSKYTKPFILNDLEDSAKCLSPSDFGFHNAKLNQDKVYFFDFEYAGWDDPAKTVCDFFYQPKYPVPVNQIEYFTAKIASSLKVATQELKERISALLPFYRIKWCTIALNDFLPSGNNRRIFANQTQEIPRKESQLDKARAIFKSEIKI